ncbi:MAG: hypothetical protein IKO55_11530, partial [Kiritimatiellae bacterium]|nr:hypothetical protein [Kiritimatiellia bacterium]
MNMKKKIGICATLLAALLCAVPQSTQAAIRAAYGKIRSIEVNSSSPYMEYTFPNPQDPMGIGGEISITFHL